jgi:hypothetical protein
VTSEIPPTNYSASEPAWRIDARAAVRPYQLGLDLLASALDLAKQQIVSAGITMEAMSSSGVRSVLPIAAARTVGTVDAAHALVTVGRVEQAEMLNRTLMDLEMDTLLLLWDGRAFDYYRDWAKVEQARLALKLRVNDQLRPGHDLDDRRRVIGNDLISRLVELEFPMKADLESAELDIVLSTFCKLRFNNKWPASWRQGFRTSVGMDRNDLHAALIESASRELLPPGAPEDIRSFFVESYGRELDLFYNHRSGEIHNSPLTLNGLIDADTWQIRFTGNLAKLPVAVAGAFSHLHRQMIFFQNSWTDEPDFEGWVALTDMINSWMNAQPATGAEF